MKKIVLIVLVVFALGLAPVNSLFANGENDIQAIKKAVKKNPNYESGKEVRWFKVLVTDTRTKKDKVKVTLPISLIEIFLNCSKDKKMKIDCDEFDIDIRELFAELKNLGPMMFIEVCENDEMVKVWME